jgi:PPP family 3-phenylpropionic acid transporter
VGADRRCVSIDLQITVTGYQLRVRLSLLYASVYLHYGFSTPFLPVWFNYKGMSSQQIGILLSVPMFLKILIVAPIANMADRLQRVRDILWIATAAAVLSVLTLSSADRFWSLLAIFTTFSLVWDPIPVLVDAYAITASRAKGLAIGQLRMFGSLAFIAFTLLGGRLLDRIGPARIIWWCAAALAIPLLTIPLLPQDRVFASDSSRAAGSWRDLLHDRALLALMTGAALLIASHAIVNNFSSIQWLGEGLSGNFVGMLWGVAMGSEVFVLWYSQRWLKGRPPIILAFIGALAALLRWCAMALHPTVLFLPLLQALQGISGIAPILAVMIQVERGVPSGLTATAQGANAVIVGAAVALSTLASGFLWRTFGTGAYGFMALLALVALLILWVGSRGGRQEVLGAPGFEDLPRSRRSADTYASRRFYAWRH